MQKHYIVGEWQCLKLLINQMISIYNMIYIQKLKKILKTFIFKIIHN